MLELGLALGAGVLTIAAPCVLPMLPILLGASVGQHSRTRPFFLALGFIFAFSAAALAFSVFPHLLGVSPDGLRSLATVLLVAFGLLLLWPQPFEWLAMHLGGLVQRADAIGGRAGSGNGGGFVLGMTLGVVWTPCAGPVLGSILTLIAGSRDLGRGAALLGSYALGASVPMLAIAYGGQWASTRVRRFAPYTVRLQQAFGVIVIAAAAAIHFEYDARVAVWLARFYPSFLAEGDGRSVASGAAPELAGLDTWLNSPPLRLENLRGKVVLVDFWTYSCINCLRTVPHVQHLHETYAAAGLVVIGVHTPQFAFERDSDNVRAAVDRLGIGYAVAQDNAYATWRAYGSTAWPTQVIVDGDGEIVLARSGEGHDAEIENRIRVLLGAGAPLAGAAAAAAEITSAEMVLGLKHLSGFAGATPRLGSAVYALPAALAPDRFGLSGAWAFDEEKVTTAGGAAEIVVRFRSGKAHVVASSDVPVQLGVVVDGERQPDVTVRESRLYTVFDGVEGEHALRLTIPAAGVRVYSIAF